MIDEIEKTPGKYFNNNITLDIIFFYTAIFNNFCNFDFFSIYSGVLGA